MGQPPGACATGVGCAVGAPAIAVGSVAALQGASTFSVASVHLLSDGKTKGSGETGSYTNTHESGKTYSGKGSRERSQTSARRIEQKTGDRHVATHWTPAANEREAFKDESRRIDASGGAKSPSNYNEIESPGKNYRDQDGSH